MLLEVSIILLLVAVNGVFAGAEISIISVRRSRLLQLVEERRPGALAVEALRRVPERFLATVQVGITVVGATAAAFSGASISNRLALALQGLGWSITTATDVALGLVIAVISYLSLVFGELVPKSLALRSGERYALLGARPLQALAWLGRPLVWFLTASSNLVLRPFGDVTSFTETRLSTEELQHLVEEAAQSGSLDERSSEIASRALDFGELTAAAVMVPRNHVVAVPREADLAGLRRIVTGARFSRMPVYEKTLDNVVGYITMRDVLALAWDREALALADILRPAFFVPETTRAGRVLQEMQRRRVPMAIVVDEHGGMAGLITLEDLVEELVGDLASEDGHVERPLRLEPDGSALVKGATAIRDVNRELGLDLPEGDGWTTIAGLCIELSGGIPQPGTRLRSGDRVLEVVEASGRAVGLVRVTPAPAGPYPTTSSA
jgi:putative hemolysin